MHTDWLKVSMAAVPPARMGKRPKKKNEKARFLSWYHESRAGDCGTNPDDYDPAYVMQFMSRVNRFFGKNRYFGLDASGFEHIPEEASLFVSNHSGGAAAPDAWGFFASWHNHFGGHRPLHALAHEMVLSVRAVGEPFSKCGVLRADPDMGLRVLRDWKRDLLVMPGGDVDVFRPHRDRYKVNFAGRRGYIRLALKAGVPIVPVANAGAHDTLIVLTDGKRIAKHLKLKELFRLNVFPIHLSLPFGLTVGPLPHLPPPVLLRYRFGPPVLSPGQRLAPGEEPSDALVDAYDKQVQAALQRLLDNLDEEAVPPHRHMLNTCKYWYRKLRRL